MAHRPVTSDARRGGAALLRGAGAAMGAGAVAAMLLVVPTTHIAAQNPAILTEAPLTGKEVEFHAVMHPDTVYVGQQANYQVGVFLGDEVRARLRRNPEFVPPEMAGVLGYDLPVTHLMVPDRDGGRYEAHVFERAVFPLTAGLHEIPAARLSYSLPLNRSFFSREESFLLRTAPVHLVALPAPAAGRPADYDGAIGSDLEIGLRLAAGGAPRVGDPLLVTVRVSGRGNVNLFPRPRLDVPWGTAVATAERVTLDTTTRSIRGSKEFDWLLTPRLDGARQLPVVRYPYFDPERPDYLAATTLPETVHVATGTLAALDSGPVAAQHPLTLRERWRGAAPRPPAQAPVYWLAVVLLPLPSLVVRLRRRRRRDQPLPSAASRLAALGLTAAGDDASPAAVRELRALFLRTLAERLALPSLPTGDSRAFVRALRLEGVSVAVAGDAAALLTELDRAVYAVHADASPPSPRSLVGRAQAVARAVDEEARRRPGMPAVAAHPAGTLRVRAVDTMALLVAATAAALLGVGSLRADATVQPSPAPALAASALFADGVTLYSAGQFAAAYDNFAAVAARVPRAPDAWANAGTAAWAAGDTAAAAVGWQRALRLEPAARDVRQRLALLPGDQLAGAAAMPPVSQTFLQWLAIGAWGVAALLALVSAVGGGSLVTASVGAFLVIAVLGGGAAAVVGERQAARDLVVVAEGAVLRDQPALAAAARRPLVAGEIVRVRARAGVWTRIEVGTETGWVERQRLRELGVH